MHFLLKIRGIYRKVEPTNAPCNLFDGNFHSLLAQDANFVLRMQAKTLLLNTENSIHNINSLSTSRESCFDGNLV